MSIKIFTYYYTNNYGAQLQSLCLKGFLEENLKLKVDYAKYLPKKLLFKEIYSPMLTKNLFKSYQFMKKNYYFSRWKKKMRIPKPKFSRYANNALISIYGSDEIWNYMNPYFGFDPYFFGEKNDGFKIAYSASIGKADINKLNNFQEKKIKGLLNSYNFISVRDTNTANFVNKMTNQSPFITVDPTLLSTPNVLKNYINAIDEKSKKYALIYGTIFSNEEKKKILNYCKKKNIQSISIGYNNNWVDKNYIWATPTDFIKYLSRADIVFTSMFHGIVLSVKLKKQFWYSIDPIRKSKISYFIDYLNLSSRLLSKSENLTAEFDYEKN